jgi:2-polyprenyl-3-methyl-5-hydroxy-6-metoxy-1,4-benzoquinol methylase
MAEIGQGCPLCGSSINSPFDQREFRGIPVSNVICHQCGLVYQSPRMTEAERQAFYQQGYRTLYQGQESPKPADIAAQEARARVILDFLGERIRPASSVLDIGCSTGILLQQFQKHYQAHAYGVEPGIKFREYAQASGLVVYSSLEELNLASSRHFHLISMMHVLEHLPDPLIYLKNLRSLLEPDGWLLLEVPNLYAHDCFEVAHLISFSPHSLSQLVRKAGYEILQLRIHGLPRSRLIPLYLTLLAHPAPDEIDSRPVSMESGIKLKRRLGLLRRRIIERLLPGYAWQDI